MKTQKIEPGTNGNVICRGPMLSFVVSHSCANLTIACRLSKRVLYGQWSHPPLAIVQNSKDNKFNYPPLLGFLFL